jgi:hypothetical protein
MKSEVVTAVVQAGSVETEYVRAGTGRPVVLLLRAWRPGAIAADPLFVGLSRELRVIAPEVPADRELTAWVRGLVDGLGLDHPAVVVDIAVAGATVPVVLEEDRCSCVVVLRPAPSRAATAPGGQRRDHGPGPVAVPGALRSVATGAEPVVDVTVCRVPLLGLDLDASGGITDASLAELITFLRRSG